MKSNRAAPSPLSPSFFSLPYSFFFLPPFLYHPLFLVTSPGCAHPLPFFPIFSLFPFFIFNVRWKAHGGFFFIPPSLFLRFYRCALFNICSFSFFFYITLLYFLPAALSLGGAAMCNLGAAIYLRARERD